MKKILTQVHRGLGHWKLSFLHAATLWLGVSAPAQELGEGLVAYWPLDDGILDQSAFAAADLTGLNPMDVFFPPDDPSPWRRGPDTTARGALHVDGLDAYGFVLDSQSLDIGSDAVTLALWVRLEQLPSQLTGSFAGIFDSEGDAYIIYLDKGNNELRFKVTADNGAGRPGIPGGDLTLGQWLHITGVYNGAQSLIYLNGELKDTHGTPSGFVKIAQAAGIGRNGSQPSNFFSGDVSEIAVWNRALNPQEITKVIAGDLTDVFDSDTDGLRDDWEQHFFTNLNATAAADSDGDLLDNAREYKAGTDPTKTDTDGDGIDDFTEVTSLGTNPLSADSDGDQLTDSAEVNDHGTSPVLADTDGDGVSDGDEVNRAQPLNPLLADTDGDDLGDGDELTLHLTDPLNPDSDGDTYPDSFEVRDSGAPLDAAFHPRMARLGLASGLVSLWTFDDKVTSGTVDQVKDARAQNNLTLIAPDPSAAWLDGVGAKHKGSLRIDGENSYVPLPNTPTLNGGSEKLTLATWVKLDQLPADLTTGFSGIFDAVEDAYVFYLDKGNNELRFKVSATGAERPGIPAADLTVGEWLHVVGVYDGTTSTAQIYLNGNLADTHNAPSGPVKAGQVAAIGRNGTDNSNFFSGAVDDVAIWNDALTAAQIGVLFSGIPPGDNDLDDDGLPDEWENLHFGNLDHGSSDDDDGDSLTNAEELDATTDPTLADTDLDGLSDGDETKTFLTNPLDPDSDADGFADAFELRDSGDPLDNTFIPRYATLGVTTGLVSLWTMDDDPTSNAIADAMARNELVLSEFAPPQTRLVGENAKFGNSIALDGFDAWVDVPNSESLNLATTAVSLAAWVWLTDLPQNSPEAYSGIFDAESDAYVLYLDRGNAELRFKVTANGAQRPGIPATELATQEWLHVAAVYDGVAGTSKIYLNGTLMDTHSGPTGPVQSGQVAAMGRNGAAQSSFFNGALDDVAIWNVALNELQVNALYRNEATDPNDTDRDGLLDTWEIDNFGNLDRDGSGDFDADGLTEAEELAAGTSPKAADSDSDGASDAYEVARGTDPLDSNNTPLPEGTGLAAGLIAYWPFDDGLADPDATSVIDATAVNPLTLTFPDPASFWLDEADATRGGALRINGFDSFVTVPNSKSLDIGGDAVTISAWLQLKELPSELFEAYSGIYDSANDAYVLYLDRSTAELRFKVTATGAQRPGIPEAELTKNQWIHVAGVYDGAASQSHIYLNGILVDTHAGPTGNLIPDQIAGIGRDGTAEASFFDGAIDELALWNRALLPEEVAALSLGAGILGAGEPGPAFRILTVERDPTGDVSLAWSSAPDATYSIEFNPTLTAGDWATVQDGITSGGDQTSITITPSAGASEGYYRVVLERN